MNLNWFAIITIVQICVGFSLASEEKVAEVNGETISIKDVRKFIKPGLRIEKNIDLSNAFRIAVLQVIAKSKGVDDFSSNVKKISKQSMEKLGIVLQEPSDDEIREFFTWNINKYSQSATYSLHRYYYPGNPINTLSDSELLHFSEMRKPDMKIDRITLEEFSSDFSIKLQGIKKGSVIRFSRPGQQEFFVVQNISKEVVAIFEKNKEIAREDYIYEKAQLDLESWGNTVIKQARIEIEPEFEPQLRNFISDRLGK